MKEWDNDWLHFAKRTRRGIFVLLILFVLIAVGPRLYYNYFASAPRYDIQISTIDNANNETKEQKENLVKMSNYTQPEELFDPNKYTIEEWMAIGLSEKQAQSILNYLGSGAHFRVKSDLLKSYVIDSSLYALLRPKINLPEGKPNDINQQDPKRYNQEEFSEQFLARDTQTSEKDSLKPIQINTASQKELEKISGIGPFFAKEIINKREKFGGIININELLDIYNMDEEKLNEIKPFLIIDKEHVNKLNINTASEQELNKHPYISSDMAHSIVYFRKNYKTYKSLDELLLSPYINSKTLNKLRPYLKVK